MDRQPASGGAGQSAAATAKWSAIERHSRAAAAADAAGAAAGFHASPRKRRAQPVGAASPAPPTPTTVAAAAVAAAALNAPAAGTVPAPQTAAVPLHDPWSDAALPSLPRAQRLHALASSLAASTAATAAGLAADAAEKHRTQLHAHYLADAEPHKSNAPDRAESSAAGGAAPPTATPPRSGRRARGAAPPSGGSDSSPIVPVVPRRLAGARSANAPGEPAGVSAHFVALPRSNSAELRRKLSPQKPMSSVVSGFDATKMLLRAAAPNPNVYAIDLSAAAVAASNAAAGHGATAAGSMAGTGGSGSGSGGSMTGRGDAASELRAVRGLSKWFEAEWGVSCAPDKADDSAMDKAQQRLCERTFRELLLQVAAGQPFDADDRRPVSARDVGTSAEVERAHLLSHVVGEWHRVLQRAAHRRVDAVLRDAEDAHARDQKQLRDALQHKLDALTDELARGRVALDTLQRQSTNQQLTLEHLHGRTDRDLLDAQRAVTERDVQVTRLQNAVKVLENKLELAGSERAALEAERAALQCERHAWADEREQLQQLVRSQQQRMNGMVPITYAVAQHQQLIDAAASGISAGEASHLLLALPPPQAGAAAGASSASGQQPSGSTGTTVTTTVIGTAQVMTIGGADRQGKGAAGGKKDRRNRRRTGQSASSSSALSPTSRGTAAAGGPGSPAGGGGGENIFAMDPAKRNAAAIIIQSWCRGHMVRRQPNIQKLRARLPIATHAPTRKQAKAYAAARAAYAIAAAGAAAARARALQGSPLVSGRERERDRERRTTGSRSGQRTPQSAGARDAGTTTAAFSKTAIAAVTGIAPAQQSVAGPNAPPSARGKRSATDKQHRRQRSDSSAESSPSRAASPRTMGERIRERDAAVAAAVSAPHELAAPIPRFFTELMRGVVRHSGARRHFVRVSTRRNLLKWISQLYAEKLGSDQLVLQQSLQLRAQLAAGAPAPSPTTAQQQLAQPPHQRMSFPEFIYAYYVYRHGAKLPAEMDLLDLFASVERHRSHKRVALFARLLNGDLPYLRASPAHLLDTATAARPSAAPAPATPAAPAKPGVTVTPAVGPLPAPSPSPPPKAASTPDDQKELERAAGESSTTAAADDDGVLEPASPGNDASLASEPVTPAQRSQAAAAAPAAGTTAAAGGAADEKHKQPLTASDSKGALVNAGDAPPPLALNSPVQVTGDANASALLSPPQPGATKAGSKNSSPVLEPTSTAPAAGMGSPPQRRPNTSGTTGGAAAATATSVGVARGGAGGVWLTRELQMELGVGLEGGSSLTARTIEFFTALLDAARVLGFGPTFNLTTAADTDGACWVLARGVQQLFSRVFDRFPPAAVTAALQRVGQLEVSKHAIKTLHTSAGGSDTKYVDFDAAAELALDLYLAEDARLQDLLFVRYAVSTDAADADLNALGPKDKPNAAADPLGSPPGPGAYAGASAGTGVGTGASGGAAGSGRRRLAATKFSLNQFTAVVHGLALDWDDLHVLRVYQQALQRRSDGSVSVDDFVYALRAHGALPVRMNWDVLGTTNTGSAANGGNATTAPTPTAASAPLPLSVLIARNSADPSAAAAAIELARLKSGPLSPSTTAAVAAMTGMAVVPGMGAGAGVGVPGRSMSLLHSGLADMRERMLELDTRWSHKVDALQSEHARALDRMRFTHDEQVRVLVRDTTARIQALEQKLEAAEHTHAVEYNALFEDHLKEVQQLIAYYDKRDAGAGAGGGHGTGKGGDAKGRPPLVSALQRKAVPGAAPLGVTFAAGTAGAGAEYHTTVTPVAGAHPPAIVTAGATAAAAVAGGSAPAPAVAHSPASGSDRGRAGRSLTPPTGERASSDPDSPGRGGGGGGGGAKNPPVGSTSSEAVNTLRRLLLKQETHAKVHVNAHANLKKQMDELKAKHAQELKLLRDSNYFVRRVERERDDLKRAVDGLEKLNAKLRSDNDMLRKALLHAAERAGLGQDWVAQTLRMYVSSSPRHAGPRLSPFSAGASGDGGSGGAEFGFGSVPASASAGAGHHLSIHPHAHPHGPGATGTVAGASADSAAPRLEPASGGIEIRLSPPPVPAAGRGAAAEHSANAAAEHDVASATHGAVASSTVASISAQQHATVRPSLFTFPTPGGGGMTAAQAAAASAAAGADLHHHRAAAPATVTGAGRQHHAHTQQSQQKRGSRWRAAAAKARRSTFSGISAGGTVGASIAIPARQPVSTTHATAAAAAAAAGGIHTAPVEPSSASQARASQRLANFITSPERAVTAPQHSPAAVPVPAAQISPPHASAGVAVAGNAAPSGATASAAHPLAISTPAALTAKMPPALAAVSNLAAATFASLLDTPHSHSRPVAVAAADGRAVTPGTEIDRLLQSTGVAVIREESAPKPADTHTPKARAAAALAAINAAQAAAVGGGFGGALGGTPTASSGGSAKSSPASDSPAGGRRRLAPSARLSLNLQRASYAAAAASAAAAAAAVAATVPTTAPVMTGAIPAPTPLPVTGVAHASGDAATAAAAASASAYTPDAVAGLVEARRASGTARPALAERDLFYETRRLSQGTRGQSGRSLLSP